MVRPKLFNALFQIHRPALPALLTAVDHPPMNQRRKRALFRSFVHRRTLTSAGRRLLYPPPLCIPPTEDEEVLEDIQTRAKNYIDDFISAELAELLGEEAREFVEAAARQPVPPALPESRNSTLLPFSRPCAA